MVQIIRLYSVATITRKVQYCGTGDWREGEEQQPIHHWHTTTTLEHVLATRQSSFSLLTLCPAPATSTYVRSLYSTACPASWPSNAEEGRVLCTYEVQKHNWQYG